MSPKVTKSKNLHLYPHFFKYDDPSDIFDKLGEQLGEPPNKLRGMMRAARRESTIYTALRLQGYGDQQIPPWFKRPDEPLVYRRAASAEPRVGAVKRSGAEVASAPLTGDTVPMYVARERSAERFSALSVRSAPPANVYRMVQPVYQSPMNPLIEEAHRQIRESHEEEMRAKLDKMKRRRHPPNPKDVIMGEIEAFKVRQKVEARNTAQMMSNIIMINAINTPKHVDVEEIKEQFTKPLAEMRLENGRQLEEDRETVAAIGELLEGYIPQNGPPDDFIHNLKVANQEREKNEREDIIESVKMISEKHNTPNLDLLFLEDQSKKLRKIFREMLT